MSVGLLLNARLGLFTRVRALLCPWQAKSSSDESLTADPTDPLAQSLSTADRGPNHLLQCRAAPTTAAGPPVAGGQLVQEQSREWDGEISREIAEYKWKAELFSSVIDAAPNGMLVTDRNGAIIMVSAQVEKLFGYPREELLGQPIETLLPKRYRELHPKHRERFFTMPQARPMGAGREIFGLRKDGSEFAVEIGLNPIETQTGTQVLASIIDITERKASEELLRQSEARFRSMITNVKDHAIFMLDCDGLVLTWNKGAEAVRGYHSEEVIGKHFSCFYTAEDIQSGKPDRILNTARADGQCEDEGWRLRKDGSKYWANVVITAVRNGGNKLLGFSNVTRDLTWRRRVEEELQSTKEDAESANETKSAFLANVSHEIRTPMTGIFGMAGLLSETELTPRQKEYCDIIKQSGDALLTIINELLDFSKIESGKMELEIIDFNLRSAVDDVVRLFAKQAADNGVELIHSMNYTVPSELRGDPGRLRQVLSNLVGNALKFTARGEVVVGVTVEEQSEEWAKLRFEVSDTGIGIAENKIGQLFSAFTQADASITRKYGGTGLGLALCKKFVDLMGGQIGVSSVEGQGSRFWFSVQLAKSHDAPRLTPVPYSQLRGLHVLMAQGNRTARTVLEHYLSSLEISYDTAEDSAAALELLARSGATGKAYDLAIIDFNLDFILPGMNGFELAHAVRRDKRWDGLKLVILTAVGKRGDGEQARRAGIDGYLINPVSLSQLIECLALVMGKHGQDDPSGVLITRHSLGELKEQRRLRILVADDNHINQKVTRSLLENLGHRADVVGNGKEAVEAYKLVPYEIVLLDLQMPEMDGFEANRQIRSLQRERGRHSSIIAVTAHAMAGFKEQCIAAGFDDYISKPILPQELKRVIDRAAAKSSTEASVKDLAERHGGLEAIDIIDALDRVEGNRELFGEIAKMFLDQYPRLLEEIRQALSAANCKTLTGAVHMLGSSAGQVGAGQALAIARAIEELGSRNDLASVSPALAELEAELSLVRSALNERGYGLGDSPRHSVH